MSTWMQRFIDQWHAWIFAMSWQLVLWIALIAAVAWLAKGASPRVRYLLWLLVLLKVFVPPTLALPWGFGTWGIRPVWQQFQDRSFPTTQATVPLPATAEAAAKMESDSPNSSIVHTATPLFLIWLAGCGGVCLVALWQYRRLLQKTREMELVDEGPLRVELERLALDLGIKKVPELYLSSTSASPYLFGLLQPKVVIPRQLMEKLSPTDQQSVLAHELCHWSRHDLWVGWLQVVAQGLFWFHPFLWWANARLRQERECACDERVLRMTECDPVNYGESLLRVLSDVRGKALFQGNLVGVFEPGANIQQRLEEIMNYGPEQARVKPWWFAVLAVLALIFLPMAAVTSATSEAADPPKALPAWVVATSPAIGATGVDPKTSEITITFDRDMQQGMSWTGGPPLFPETAPDAIASWRDKRTCVLPVKLKAGEYYRVGINSTSYQNFRSETGQPAPCTAIYFATEGASKAVESRVRVPEITKMIPANGATDVDPETKVLRVTFNVPMGEGMSWTGGGETFPAPREGEQAKWSSDGKTCLLPVTLEPSHEYRLGINSLSHINFQSKWGVPAVPVLYQFKTSGGE